MTDFDVDTRQGPVLRPDGTLHVHQATGLGWLIERVINNKTLSADLLARIAAGPLADGENAFFSQRRLARILREHGLALDRSRPTEVQYCSLSERGSELARMDHAELAGLVADPRFRQRVRSDKSLLGNVERSLSFNARIANAPTPQPATQTASGATPPSSPPKTSRLPHAGR